MVFKKCCLEIAGWYITHTLNLKNFMVVCRGILWITHNAATLCEVNERTKETFNTYIMIIKKAEVITVRVTKLAIERSDMSAVVSP